MLHRRCGWTSVRFSQADLIRELAKADAAGRSRIIPGALRVRRRLPENPAVVTIYVGRGHSSIVRELRASIPVRVVAVNHDTRVVTIERTYSRHIGDHADVLARKALLDLAATPSSYVVPIAAGR